MQVVIVQNNRQNRWGKILCTSTFRAEMKTFNRKHGNRGEMFVMTGDRVQSQDLADSMEAESKAQCKVKLVSPQNNFLAGSDALFEDIFADCRAHNPYPQQHLASSLRLGTNPQPQLANRPTLVAPKLAHNISNYQHGNQQLRAQKVPHTSGFNHGVYPQQLQQTPFNQNQANTLLPTNDLIAQNQIMKQNSMHSTYPLQQSASQFNASIDYPVWLLLTNMKFSNNKTLLTDYLIKSIVWYNDQNYGKCPCLMFPNNNTAKGFLQKCQVYLHSAKIQVFEVKIQLSRNGQITNMKVISQWPTERTNAIASNSVLPNQYFL